MFQSGYSPVKKLRLRLIAVELAAAGGQSPSYQAMKDAQSPLDLNLNEPIVCRSVWISDIHLGTRHARVAELLDFLRVVDCKYLYLVGDFIDGWELKFRWFWRDD